MKPSLTSQEQELRSQGRHRMIGAAVIMLIVVLLLPMILNHATTPKLPEAIEPAPDSLPTAVALPSPNPVPATTEATEADPAAKPLTAVEVTAEATTPTIPVPVPDASAASGMMLQVGVFANPDRAAALAKRLNQQGIHTVTDFVHHKNGDRTHVRVGPVANRAEAMDMKARLKKIGVDAVIKGR